MLRKKSKVLKDLTQVSETSKQKEGKALMPQRFKKNIIYFFQFSFFLSSVLLTTPRTGLPSSLQHGRQPSDSTLRTHDRPKNSGFQEYSLDWRMDIPSIGGWIFPRLEDGYSLDWRMDFPSIGGWIFPRLEDG